MKNLSKILFVFTLLITVFPFVIADEEQKTEEPVIEFKTEIKTSNDIPTISEYQQYIAPSAPSYQQPATDTSIETSSQTITDKKAEKVKKLEQQKQKEQEKLNEKIKKEQEKLNKKIQKLQENLNKKYDNLK